MSGDFDSIQTVFVGAVVLYLVLQIAMVWAFTGNWRRAAQLPLLLLIVVAIYTVVAFVAQSNLWPIVLIYFIPLAILYFVILLVARALAALVAR